MALKTFVKVASITNLTDARYCAGMGVDMLGFQAVQGQPNYIKPLAFQEIRGWITGPVIVAEVYGIQNEAELADILENYKPDYVEMGLKELSCFSALSLPLILSVEKQAYPENLAIQPAYLITEDTFEASIPLLARVQSLEDLKKLITNKHVTGIVLKGGAELKPGLKDFEVMNDVLEFLEEEG